MYAKHAAQLLSTWTNENYFYYYRVIIVFALPINHSYKCPYGSRTVPYSASFVASSLCFFPLSFPSKRICNHHNHYENVLKFRVRVILYTRGYITQRFNSESRLKDKARRGSCRVWDMFLQGDYCQVYSLAFVLLYFYFLLLEVSFFLNIRVVRFLNIVPLGGIW